jgi:hypothetical protein
MIDQGTGRILRATLMSLGLTISLQAALAKDFKHEYALPPGGEIIVENFSGDITIRGIQGQSIEVVGKRSGEGADSIEILDSSFGNRVEIRLRPEPDAGRNAKVDFEVRVPASIGYNFARISTFSGNVDISGVKGRLWTESVRGNVTMTGVKGLVNASSFSGNITAALDKVQEPGNLRFMTISGNIDVSAPANLDALVDITCGSGQLKTEFPLEIQELRYGPGKFARGRLGAGKQILRMRSVSGRVSLTQNSGDTKSTQKQ